ncbi:MAG TPA: chemotaxis protein CheB [Myxococcales bacterium]|nr:chemotaxis protein CheB [Myxococcales bacterium]
MSRRVRVLVADDSRAIQQVFLTLLSSDPRLEVVGTAADGVEAVELARSLRPDVITMDVRMPRLDGLAATAAIMAEAPSRILVVASVAEDQQALVFRAMHAGALEVIQKPDVGSAGALASWGERLADSICLMSEVPVVTRRRSLALRAIPRRTQGRVDALGLVASTGGPPALAEILGALPADLPVPILVAQHIASGFSQGLRRWLSEITPLRVELVKGPVPVRPGTVYLPQDGLDLAVDPDGLGLVAGHPPSGTHRPSGNRLLSSIARAYRSRAGGVVLTGMGDDGAQGLLEIRRAGGAAFAQDEATCVVFGMPQAAHQLGAAEAMLPLPAIPAVIVELCAPGADLARRPSGLHQKKESV